MNFKTVEDAVNYVISKRDKKDVSTFKKILETLGIHDEGLKIIHVTGTNGKGSTVTFIRNILNAAGYKVGTFTSPYIICHQDRFMIDGKMMPDETFIHYVNTYYDAIEKYHLSMFEIDVLLSLVYFKDQKVDYCIYEVGIGGDSDKTNIIHSIASIITNVGHDHLASLGPTLEDVARHKAGIIKPHQAVFIGSMKASCEAIIRELAAKNHASCFTIESAPLILDNLPTYQRHNALLAITVIRHLFPTISWETINQGIQSFSWPARFEKIDDILIDGAHNIEAIAALLENIKQPSTVIYSALNDKDFVSMACMIKDAGHQLILCLFEDERGLGQDDIKKIPYDGIVSSIDEALLYQTPLVFCGSLHFVSDVRKKLLKS